MSTRDAILERIKSVPALPTAAIKVSHMLQDADVDIAKLARVIEHDPALAANLLKMANSAYFSGPRSVGTIHEAIMRMGTNRVFGITVASASALISGKPVKGYDLGVGELWLHSVSAAVCTDKLCETLAIKAPKEAFTAALLHDVGKIVLGNFVEVDATQILELAYDEGLSFEVAETKVLGIDHPEVGACLLDNWNLPDSIVGAVRWHQKPDKNDGRAEQLLVDIVHAADALSLVGGVGTGIDGLNYKLSEKVAERLCLTNTVAETVICRMLDGIEEFSEIFSYLGER